ncbi:hypothetical protein [Pseudothermotoga sp.]|uniref:hypothetical protein n=1 Tax=Pseudothermotoga sp. TaxID=2033661 RepID=UPI00299672B3|nr:hypothetical protein [Pseudothermotoga sp.]MCX7812182.1 hypothetical protein [Pseudothermotoga sp.]MDW8139252.1 hypothetical protein [Pseudothermotoga sp.]
MKLLVGRQIALKEFLQVDLAVSWVDQPVNGASFYLLGSDKGYILISSFSEEVNYGAGFHCVELPQGIFAITTGFMSWKFAKQASEKGANALFVFQSVSKLEDLLMAKAVCWGSSREFNIPIVLFVQHASVIHLFFCVPGQGREKSGILFDATSSCIVELDVSRTDSGRSFTVKTFVS